MKRLAARSILLMILFWTTPFQGDARADFRASFRACVAALLAPFRAPGPKDYVLEGYFPADFWLSLKPSFYRLPKGSLLGVLNEALARTAAQDQDIWSNTDYDAWLLEHAYRSRTPIEVGHMRVFDENGNVVSRSPRVAIGDQFSISEDDLWTLVWMTKRPLNTFMLEFAHVHPAYEYHHKHLKGGVRKTDFYLSNLSPDDLALIRELSFKFKQIYVRCRAILPNGYSYTVAFKNGERVVDPLHERKEESRRALESLKNYVISPTASEQISNRSKYRRGPAR